MGYETSETKLKCGCIRVRKTHDFFSGGDDETITLCENHLIQSKKEKEEKLLKSIKEYEEKILTLQNSLKEYEKEQKKLFADLIKTVKESHQYRNRKLIKITELEEYFKV